MLKLLQKNLVVSILQLYAQKHARNCFEIQEKGRTICGVRQLYKHRHYLFTSAHYALCNFYLPCAAAVVRSSSPRP